MNYSLAQDESDSSIAMVTLLNLLIFGKNFSGTAELTYLKLMVNDPWMNTSKFIHGKMLQKNITTTGE